MPCWPRPRISSLREPSELAGPARLLPRSPDLGSATARADLPDRIQTGLKDLGIALAALAGHETTGVTAIQDVDGVYGTWLDELGADVVLVRRPTFLPCDPVRVRRYVPTMTEQPRTPRSSPTA